MRNIAIIVGSKSDLKQSDAGLHWIKQNPGLVNLMQIDVSSQHRNPRHTRKILRDLAGQNFWYNLFHPFRRKIQPDAIIIGAGWANQLTCCSDAYLRNELHNDKIVVIGAAFEDTNPETDPEVRRKHNQAAVLSITEVPGRKVVYDDFFGAEGFFRACQFAALGELPKIVLKDPPEPLSLTLNQALTLAA